MSRLDTLQQTLEDVSNNLIEIIDLMKEGLKRLPKQTGETVVLKDPENMADKKLTEGNTRGNVKPNVVHGDGGNKPVKISQKPSNPPKGPKK
jgi:hypothetical protein